MNNIFVYFFVLVFAVGFVPGLMAQDIQSVPNEYLKPQYYNDVASDLRFENEVLKKPNKKKGEEWFVISDRTNNYLYSKPNLGSEKVDKLGFRDIVYVTKDNNGWLLVGNKSGGSVSELGWIPKSNVLQWRRGLLDAASGINLKGFILNKLKKLQLQSLEYADVYDTPDGTKSIGKLSLHDFYFVFKVYKDESGVEKRYLLANNNEISSRSPEYLQGWVDVEKITEWNTRLCLEPNFLKEAFDERAKNDKFQIKGFARPRTAEKITSGNYAEINSREVHWDGDPAKSDYATVGDTRRFNGEQIRFPILENQPGCYASGILATIAEQSDNSKSDVGVIDLDPEILQEINDRNDNLNLVFVMEGCDEIMSQYSGAVQTLATKMIKESQYRNVQVTMGLYKDILEKEASDYIRILKPTQNTAKISEFLASTYWGKNGDFEEMTCWKYGLYETIRQAGLSANATNVVIQLGNYADFSIDEFRVEDASKKYIMDRQDLRNQFSKYDINWVVANVNNDDSYFSDAYNDDIRETINDITKGIYTEYSKKLMGSDGFENAKIPVPYTPKLKEGNQIETKDFITVNRFLRTDENKSISPTLLTKFISESIDKINEVNSQKLKSLSGSTLEVDSKNMVFTPAVMGILRSQLSRAKGIRLGPGEVGEQLDGIKMFANIYFAKQQPSQKYPPFSIVLFMPETDLISYVEELDKLSYALDQPKDQARKQLQYLLTDLFQTRL